MFKFSVGKTGKSYIERNEREMTKGREELMMMMSALCVPLLNR